MKNIDKLPKSKNVEDRTREQRSNDYNWPGFADVLNGASEIPTSVKDDYGAKNQRPAEGKGDLKPIKRGWGKARGG